MIFLKGWLGTPKLVYNILLWTVNTTDQKGIFPTIGYQFSRKFSLYAGINGIPGTRSIMGSHPFWLGTDRVMTDEFFRPFFTYSVWAQGEALPGFWYNVVRRQQQQRPRRQGRGPGPQVLVRRLRLVDADDARVRPARGLRRLGVARQAGHAVRRGLCDEPGEPPDQRHHGPLEQHHL